ncbi:interferon-induced protein 44-like [Salminus brasiliensis]|uniref:interferon-induced protein 44-like n=1 Tax=Salminus brasiliensis TaxID=930266 RepID=UPI003B836D74
MEDEGNYTVTIQNRWGSASCSAMVLVELDEWRIVQWKQDPMINALKSFRICSGDIRELRFLLYGPVGSGKSSIINTIHTIFEGHPHIHCPTADLTCMSFTRGFEKYNIRNLPFAFYNLMGLEQGQSYRMHPDDIMSVLKGHIPNNYTFHPHAPIDKDNRHYILNPTLNDRIHCLVSVIPADKISLMSDEVIQKMKTIRAAASKLGIPHVVFMTRVDQVCIMTHRDLTKIYRSRRIKEQVSHFVSRIKQTAVGHFNR